MPSNHVAPGMREGRILGSGAHRQRRRNVHEGLGLLVRAPMPPVPHRRPGSLSPSGQAGLRRGARTFVRGSRPGTQQGVRIVKITSMRSIFTATTKCAQRIDAKEAPHIERQRQWSSGPPPTLLPFRNASLKWCDPSGGDKRRGCRLNRRIPAVQPRYVRYFRRCPAALETRRHMSNNAERGDLKNRLADAAV